MASYQLMILPQLHTSSLLLILCKNIFFFIILIQSIIFRLLPSCLVEKCTNMCTHCRLKARFDDSKPQLFSTVKQQNFICLYMNFKQLTEIIEIQNCHFTDSSQHNLILVTMVNILCFVSACKNCASTASKFYWADSSGFLLHKLRI